MVLGWHRMWTDEYKDRYRDACLDFRTTRQLERLRCPAAALGGCLIAAPLVNASFALAASTARSWFSPRSALLAAATCASRQRPSMWNARSGRTGRKTQSGVATSASQRGRLRPLYQPISCTRILMRQQCVARWRPSLKRLACLPHGAQHRADLSGHGHCGALEAEPVGETQYKALWTRTRRAAAASNR